MPSRLRWLCLLMLAACSVETGGYPNGAAVYGEATPPPVPAARDGSGRWEWSRENGYVWTDALQKPRPDAEWVEPHWAQRGRHYLWVHGYFR
jgi:hypothetical protein